MVQMPAVCRECGTVFPSGFNFEMARNISLKGNTAGPCPHCGGTGDLPDGMFDFVGDAIRVLAAPEWSLEHLRRIADVLRDARERHATPEEIARAVETATPGSSLSQRFLVPRNPGEFYALIGVLLTAITLLLTMKGGGAGPTDADVERIVRDAVEEVQNPTPSTARPNAKAPVTERDGGSEKAQPKKSRRPKKKNLGRRDQRRKR